MMDSNKKQIANEAIEALIALGHKHAQAKRMVNEALAGGFEPTDAASILQHVYQKPSSGPQSPRSPYAGEYAEYYSGSANYRGQHSELMQIARAVGPGLSPEEFAQLAKQVEAVQSQRDHLTGAAYQSKLWAIPEEFKRSGSVHFRPTRDRQGNPIDVSIPPVPRAAVEGLGGPAVGDAGAAAGASEALSGLLGRSGGSGQDSPSVAASDLGPIATSSSAGDSSETLKSLMATSDGGGDASASRSPMQSGLDSAQAAADALGVVDQTGITDLSNAGVSIIRAISEPERRGEHLSNAAISAISAIPIVGDLAKLGKYGGRGAKAAASGGVNAQAQAATQAVNMSVSVAGAGGSGGGAGVVGGGGGAGGGGAGGAGGGSIGQATAGLNSFSGAIQKFTNNTGAAIAGLTVAGNEVYERALKPLLGWFEQVDRQSRERIEGQAGLGGFSGQIASALQALEAERHLRSADRAEVLDGSVAQMASAQSNLESAMQQLVLPYTQFLNEITAARTEVAAAMASVLSQLDPVANGIESLRSLFKENAAGEDGKLRNDAERAEKMITDMFMKRRN